MKRLLILASMLSLLFFFSASVTYAADCGSATIKRMGVNPTNGFGGSAYFVSLDCTDDSIWTGDLSLYLNSTLGDSGLATMLTAYSLGKTVWVRTLGIDPGSLISIIYIND